MTGAVRTRRSLARAVSVAAVSASLAAPLALSGSASAAPATTAVAQDSRLVPRIQPSLPVVKGRGFVSRTAVGSKSTVRVGKVAWSADKISSGGHPVTLKKPRSGSLATLLSHARAGATRFNVKVPSAGVYRVSMLLPAARKSAATRIVSGNEPLVSGLAASAKHAQVVSFTVAVSSKTLTVAFAGPRLEVSALQVSRVSSLPSDGSLVPVRPTVTAASASTTTLPTAVPAGTSWPSGAWPGGNSLPGDVQGFADFRHRALDVISTTVPGTTWNSMATDFYGIDRYDGLPARLSISYPMLPFDRSGSLTDVIAGKDDSVFTAFGQGLVARGRGDSIVRLGWEFNGDWQPWAAFNPSQYIAAFRHEVALLRAADPAIVINWNPGYGASAVHLNPMTQLYPGDDVVDQIGLDAYDMVWYHVHDAASWASYVNNPDGGLNVWYAFAMQHGKLFSLPEWALNQDNGSGTDNPYYIQQMYAWFKAHAKGLAFEAYFNDDAPWIGSQIFNVDGGTSENPRAAAVYSELWG